MRVGVLSSGGDSPGSNAALRSAVLRGVDVHGFEMIGFVDGWRGFHGGITVPLDRRAVRGLAPRGGIMLGTSRVPPFSRSAARDEGPDSIRAKFTEYGLDGMLLIGGNGTQMVAHLLTERGIPVIGLPKTIDNDLGGTDYTFGFDTAVAVAAEAIDRLRTTGESHRRCMILEVMGRDAGWIALHAGMAAGAQVTLLPEFPESIEQIAEWLLHVRERGRSSLLVVAEGFRLAGGEQVAPEGIDAMGRPRLGGVAHVLAPLIEDRTGIETRATVLGYVQRGGEPTAFDRVLAARTGIAAVDAAKRGAWGHLAGISGDRVDLVPLSEAVASLKVVPEDRYSEVRLNFG